jgi:hypothetical protein
MRLAAATSSRVSESLNGELSSGPYDTAQLRIKENPPIPNVVPNSVAQE